MRFPKRPRVSVDQRQDMARKLHLTLRENGVPPEQTRRIVYSFFFTDVSSWCEPDWFTLGYTGWRHASRAKVWTDLTRIREQVGPMRLIVGFDPTRRTPKGGDMHAYDWGVQAPGVTVECLPAPWHLPELDKSAGPYRNGAIVERTLAAVGDRAMLAHLHPKSRGAAGTAAYAKWRGLRVIEETAI
ncbi:hypothetical protein [Nonomuraea cavernae]|uniref:Uncharacterized protein n=1 Tax=Nonomuraea cavernae TaxID=2045107 RepID=A0A917YPM9_9ACTN|nr:hypothetical protein [Nonomuraea cavernae]MCA2184672.1 hypothetical protein [Nonomuraea cavernae]GGO63104.1 hypothetical protein GCM10012289_09250 [Nonomuraea cavernae]